MNSPGKPDAPNSSKLHFVDARLPLWAQSLLISCPKSGGGVVHDWLFVTALRLHQFFPDKAELANALSVGCADCGREVPKREIAEAVRNSDPSRCRPRPPGSTWSKPNPKRIAAVVQEGPDLTGLQIRSPVKFADDQPHTEEIIDTLFPGNPLLCCAQEIPKANTFPRNDWRGSLAKQRFIVPSPMTSQWTRNNDGRNSMRTNENTGPRRFLIVEFDDATLDEQAALLMHLAQRAPMVLVVYSGNKSLHGWFYCAGEPEEKVRKFFDYAMSLGADKQMWIPCQCVRMPDAQRENGKRQKIIYYNPQLLTTP